MQMFEYKVPQNISNKLVFTMLLKLLGNSLIWDFKNKVQFPNI